MPAFRPLRSVLADFIGEFPYPRPNESPTTNHEILLYYPHRKSRRKSRHRLKQAEIRETDRDPSRHLARAVFGSSEGNDGKRHKDVLDDWREYRHRIKRAGDGSKADTYESICAFLNRNGGDVFLGVTDDGDAIGLPPKTAPMMVRQIVKAMNDPNLWEPRIAVYPEIVEYEGKTLIHIHVPVGPDVYWFKGKCYDRVDDADVVVRGTSPIAEMFIRKHEIYTEQRIVPFVTKADLRLDLLPRIRMMVQTAHDGSHPWANVDDDAILRSAKLLGQDPATGREGFNAAAVLLLGKDDTIGNCFPEDNVSFIHKRPRWLSLDLTTCVLWRGRRIYIGD